MRNVVLSIVVIWGSSVSGQESWHYGGPSPESECITDTEYQAVRSQLQKTRPVGSGFLRDDILFHDPMGDGGMNSFGKPIVFYVDLDTYQKHSERRFPGLEALCKRFAVGSLWFFSKPNLSVELVGSIVESSHF